MPSLPTASLPFHMDRAAMQEEKASSVRGADTHARWPFRSGNAPRRHRRCGKVPQAQLRGSTGRFVAEVRRQPALDLAQRHALALLIIERLVAGDFPEPEVLGLRM